MNEFGTSKRNFKEVLLRRSEASEAKQKEKPAVKVAPPVDPVLTEIRDKINEIYKMLKKNPIDASNLKFEVIARDADGNIKEFKVKGR